MRRTILTFSFAILVTIPAGWGQQAVSARAGLIQYVEGRVLLDEKAIAPKTNEFLQVENGKILATQDGRAEVLLTPGAFLRLSENSSFRMISGNLSDTRLEVLSGSGMVEVEELLKDNAITLQAGNTAIALKKHGLYRIDADGAALFRVYDGDAVLTSQDKTVNVRKGHQVELDETLAVAHFDVDDTDPFYRWSERRAGYVATANVSSARAVMGGGGSAFDSSGYGSGYGSGLGFGLSNWTYNPWFGMYTFVPNNGFGYSPFGYAIYSPATVSYAVYQPASSAFVRTTTAPTTRTAATNTSGFMVPTRGTGGAAGAASGTGGTSSGSATGATTRSAAPAATSSVGARAGGGGARGR